MAVFIIANIAITDRDEYATYQDGFAEIFTRYKGEILAVSDEPQIVEGDWPYTRAVLLRFPNAEEARSWYESADYQALAQHRWNASTGSIIAIEGLT